MVSIGKKILKNFSRIQTTLIPEKKSFSLTVLMNIRKLRSGGISLSNYQTMAGGSFGPAGILIGIILT